MPGSATRLPTHQSRAAELRAAGLLTLGFSLFTLAVFTITGFFRGPVIFRETLLIGVPMMAVDGALLFSLYFVLRGTGGLGNAKRWPLVALAVIAVALLQSLWDTQLRIWAGTLAAEQRTPLTAFMRAATVNTYNAGMFAALLACQSVILALRENQRLLVAAQHSERDAHMLALRFQLNPHFLFNTLNAISSLVVIGRAADAEAMIDRLSTFLRASLAADPKQATSVGEEFEMLDAYLQIEAIRFGERLHAVLDLPDAVAEARMPPFLLQPLVENALKYAVAPARRPVTVRVAAARAEDALLLSVSDDGDGDGSAAPGTGVGLANVRERLRLSYGRAALVDTQQGPAGYCVTIRLPIELPAVRPRPALVPA